MQRPITVKSLMFFSVFFVLLYFNTMAHMPGEYLGDWGRLSIMITLCLMLVHLAKSFIRDAADTIVLKSIYVPILLLIAVEIFGYFRSGQEYAEGFYFLQVLMLWLFILGGAAWRFRVKHTQYAGFLNGVILIIFLVRWGAENFLQTYYTSFYAFPNYAGAVFYCMFFFSVLAVIYTHKWARVVYFLLMLGNIALLYATGARAAMIGVLATLFAALFMKFFKSKFRYLFYIVLLGNALFMGVYIWLKSTSLGSTLNELSRSIFYKNLFTGRIEVWEQVFNKIMEKPFFGHGVGFDARMFTEERLTAHNFYLQIMLENGIVGLVFMLLVLFGIWKMLCRNLESFAARWSACFMIGLLVYQNFELTMTQNNYSIAMFQWLIITFGVRFIIKPSNNEDEQTELIRAGDEEADHARFENTRISRSTRHRRKK